MRRCEFQILKNKSVASGKFWASYRVRNVLQLSLVWMRGGSLLLAWWIGDLNAQVLQLGVFNNYTLLHLFLWVYSFFLLTDSVRYGLECFSQVSVRDATKARLVDDFFLDMYVFCGGLLPNKLFGLYKNIRIGLGKKLKWGLQDKPSFCWENPGFSGEAYRDEVLQDALICPWVHFLAFHSTMRSSVLRLSFQVYNIKETSIQTGH